MASEENKYLILVPVPERSRSHIMTLMNRVKVYTEIPAPHMRVIPHISLCSPIIEADKDVLRDFVKRVSLNSRQTKAGVGNITSFGKEYIVLPIYPTIRLASMWVRTDGFLSLLPAYQRSKFYYENTLHIMLARKTSKVFNKAWPIVVELHPPKEIPITHIALYHRPAGQNVWQEVVTYPLQK